MVENKIVLKNLSAVSVIIKNKEIKTSILFYAFLEFHSVHGGLLAVSYKIYKDTFSSLLKGV